MKRDLLLFSGILAAAITMTAQVGAQNYKSLPGVPSHISANGKYVVGSKVDYNNDLSLYEDFIYNTETGTYDWLTEAQMGLWDFSGHFNYVNDNGVIAGYTKDTDIIRPSSDEFDEAPISQAAIWVDGEMTKLGYAGLDPENLLYMDNGTYALGVTPDAKTVYGITHTYASYATTPVRWVYNEESGEYECALLPLLHDASYFDADSFRMSADGSVRLLECKLFGTVQKRGYLMWTDDGVSHFNFQGYDNLSVINVSPDGKYILFAAFYGGDQCVTVYDTQSRSIVWQEAIPAEASELTLAGAIDNNGKGYVTLGVDDASSPYKIYAFNIDEEYFIDLDDFFRAGGAELTGLPSNFNTNDYVAGISADGIHMVGYHENFSGFSGWYFNMPDLKPVVVNPPMEVSLFFSNPGKVVVKWLAPVLLTDDYEIVGYKVTVDGAPAVLVTPDAEEADGYFRFRKDVAGGTHNAKVVAVVKYNGKEYESREITASASQGTDTTLWFFDDFDDLDTDGNGNIIYTRSDWSVIPTGNNDVMYWHMDSNSSTNNTPFWATQSISDIPWESSLQSRWFDATDATDDFYFTYYLMKRGIANGAITYKDSETDTFNLEYTLDGENWVNVESIRSIDFPRGHWSSHYVDLSELKGKVFMVRLVARGQGEQMLIWAVDNMGVKKDEHIEGPKELRAISATSDGVQLEWTNPAGGYSLSYAKNSTQLTKDLLCVGSEGHPLIIANEYTAEQMKPYVGMTISDVSALLFDNKATGQIDPTVAEAIIYCEGEEIARSQFETDFFFENRTWGFSHCYLKEPVVIEDGKNYRIGVRISEYAETATPIWYQSESNFIPGQTDIFSEDEGRTWYAYSDFFADRTDAEFEYFGQVIWPIIVTFASAENATEWDDDILGYDIYRNGDKINNETVYYMQPNYLDKAPIVGEEATYTVRSIYRDGRVSEPSEPLHVMPAGIHDVIDSAAIVSVFPNPVSDVLYINGEFDKAALYDLNGVELLRTSEPAISVAGLASGIYLLRVESNFRADVVKIIKK